MGKADGASPGRVRVERRFRRGSVMRLLRGLVAASLVVVLASACDAEIGSDRESIELDDGTELPDEVRVHDVVVSAEREVGGFQPAAVPVAVGDAVRFEVGDLQTHAIVFDADALQPAQREFLESTQQLRGPPLVSSEMAWLVSFRDAPPGDYPVVDLMQGARGVIRVAAPSTSDR